MLVLGSTKLLEEHRYLIKSLPLYICTILFVEQQTPMIRKDNIPKDNEGNMVTVTLKSLINNTHTPC